MASDLQNPEGELFQHLNTYSSLHIINKVLHRVSMSVRDKLRSYCTDVDAAFTLVNYIRKPEEGFRI